MRSTGRCVRAKAVFVNHSEVLFLTPNGNKYSLKHTTKFNPGEDYYLCFNANGKIVDVRSTATLEVDEIPPEDMDCPDDSELY